MKYEGGQAKRLDIILLSQSNDSEIDVRVPSNLTKDSLGICHCFLRDWKNGISPRIMHGLVHCS